MDQRVKSRDASRVSRGAGAHPARQGSNGVRRNAITSAYNFAPLHQRVVAPPWQGEVSHDIPLCDGLCADLEIELTAHTPLLVGAERRADDRRGNVARVKFFSHPDGTPTVPGSSLRGMLRNVLEVATFARMQLMDDRALSLRDLYLKAYTKRLVRTSRTGGFEAATRGGWLRFDAGRGVWTLAECEVGRVEQEDLERVKSEREPGKNLRQCLVDAFSSERDKDAQRLARLKYEAIERKVGPYRLEGDESPQIHLHKNGNLRLSYRKLKLCGKNAARYSGYLVLTGQPGGLIRPGETHKSGTKHMEFVFLSAPQPTVREVAAEVMQRFREVHADSADLAYLESPASPHASRGVPVFFLLDERGEVEALGLSQMFRLPGVRSLGEMARHAQDPRDAQRPLDFVETLFGHVDAPSGALRGRIQCGDLRHVPCDRGRVQTVDPRFLEETVLGQPKPSFYPNYFVQPQRNGELAASDYQTVLSPDARLRGWKRYPVRPLAQVELVKPPQSNAKSSSLLEPMPPGSRFRGRLRLHNVKPEELGAVLWALTWGGDDALRHSLGMGKSFGFGQVSAVLTNVRIAPNDLAAGAPDTAACIGAFQRFMETEVSGWAGSDALAELRAMANPGLPQATREALRPMELSMRGTNEFAEAKKDKDHERNPKPRLVLTRYSRPRD